MLDGFLENVGRGEGAAAGKGGTRNLQDKPFLERGKEGKLNSTVQVAILKKVSKLDAEQFGVSGGMMRNTIISSFPC